MAIILAKTILFDCKTTIAEANDQRAEIYPKKKGPCMGPFSIISCCYIPLNPFRAPARLEIMKATAAAFTPVMVSMPNP